MNHKPGPVNTRVQIHERERATIRPMAAGRGTDEAVIWYCHYRLRKLLAEGATQKEIAGRGPVPRSAVNHLLKHAKGVGSTTAAGFAKIYGFATRGQLTDAADLWWATSAAREYAKREWAAMVRGREIRDIDDTVADGEKKHSSKTA